MARKIRACFCIVVFLCAAASIGCSRDSVTAADPETPLYTNEYGEEIFGPSYRPDSPEIESVPLLIGTPKSGATVPPFLRGMEHRELMRLATEPADAGPEEAGARSLGIPLLKSFRTAEHIEAGNLEFEQVVPAAVEPTEDGPTEDGGTATMTAHFVFVGQGDGAVLEFPCGVAVIDTGGEPKGGDRFDGGQAFVDYLTEFFAERPHFNNTIDVLFTTHPHSDHLNGLPLLQNDDGSLRFSILNVVDNGQTAEASSMGKQTAFRRAVRANNGRYSAVELSRQIAATGATNDVIDPLNCDDEDPVITVFWGGLNEELPDGELLSTSEYGNPNNHSLVIRIDFGEASFLFTGDLEDRGERDLRNQFDGNHGVFDVDVYQVSHHGADDDTSDAWLEIMTPSIAVISMGTTESRSGSTAFDHGHPRTGLLAVLQDEPGIIGDLRDPPEQFPAAEHQNTDFRDVLVERAIFGTGWEGTILIEASNSGDYEIFTE